MSALDKINLNGTRYNLAVPTAEMTQTAVNEWLDEHPEATTTVEDGAITDAKLNSSLKIKTVSQYNSISDMVADTSLVVGQACRVNGLCYEAFDAYNVTYDVVDEEDNRSNEFVSIALANGLRAVPSTDNLPSELPRNTIETQNAVINTALSYVDRSDFEYGHNTLFAERCVHNANSKFEIDCSSLVQAALMGINYSSSRYALGNSAKNLPADWGFSYPTPNMPSSVLSPVERKYGYLANELALYCYTHGYLYEINELGTNVQAGDIVFEVLSTSATERYFCRIGHTGVVMQNMGGGAIRIIEAGNGQTRLFPVIGNYVCAVRTYACGTNSTIKYGARIPIVAGDESREITSVINDIPQSLTGNISTSNYLPISAYTNEVVQKGQLYTIEIGGDFQSLKGSLDTRDAHLRVTVRLSNTSDVSLQEYTMSDATHLLDNDKLYVTYTPLRDYDTSSAVRVYISSDTANIIYCNIPITSFKIWKGAPLDIINESNVSVSVESAITVNRKCIRNKKLFLDITIPSVASGVSETKIASVDVFNALYSRLVGNAFTFAPASFSSVGVYIQRGEMKIALNATSAVNSARFVVRFDFNDY